MFNDYFAKLVYQWNTQGIIYEGDFGILPGTLENEGQSLIRALLEAGCEVSSTMIISAEVENQGWMYAMFDLSRYEPKEVEEMIRRKFGQKNS